MANEIESLSISIEAKAQKANSSIDKLVSRLDVLSNSLGKLQNGSNNLVALGRGVESLSRGMQGFKGVGEAKFIRLANGINQLANINTQGLNNAASSLSHMTRAFNNIGAVSQNAVQVSDLAKNLGKLGNKSVTNAITKIPKLATAMNNLMTTLSKAPKVSENVIRMTNALANLSAQGAKVGSASNSIVRGLNRASDSATRARASFGGLASAIGKFYATYFLLFRVFNGLWKSINMTADYVEAFNYFTVSMGKIASKWDSDWENYGDENARNYSNKFVTTLNSTFSKLSGVSYDPQTGLLSETGLKNLGLNLQEVTQYAAQLSSMMDAVGQSGETTLATTNAFVKLAGDISSLYNIDYQQAADKIRSVLQGQSRAGYGFGWDTTMAALQATADRLDLSKAVSEMSQMEKQQLRILTILEQSRVAWGDQSNTINTLANQIRLFKNNIKEAGMLLGQLFVPILTKLMPIINGVTIAIKRLLSSIAGLLGIEIKDVGQGFSGIEEDIDGIGDSFDDATASAKKFKTYTLGIDELNIQPEQAESGGSGGGGIGGGIDLTDEILQATSEYEKVWQEAFDKMENRAQEFADKIEEFFAPITEPLKKLFKDISIGDWFSAGQDTSNLISGVFDLFSNALEKVDWEKIGNNIGDYLRGIDWGKILQSAGNFIENLVDAAIKLWKGTFIADPITTTIITALAAAKFTGLGSILSSKIMALLPTGLTIAITAIVFFEVGKDLGKLINPEDAQWYDNFKFFGDDGFFKTVTENWGGTFAAIINMARDFQNNPVISSLTVFLGGGILLLPGIGMELDNLSQKITTFMQESVAPWFTAEKWQEFADGAKFGLQNKWAEIVEWWDDSAIGTWFDKSVKPWFSKEKWSNLLSSIPEVFSQAFKSGANLAIGFLNKIIEGIESLINGAISALSTAEDLLNKIPGIELSFDIPEIKLLRIPTFQTGGFPDEYSLFMAGEHGHAEMLGTVGGRTAVAGGAEITGIRDAVYQSSQTEAELLREQNELLRQLLAKDTSVNIGDRDIARANARGSKSLGYALIY